jgi:hypothetical protein
MAASSLMPVIWFFLLTFGAGATLYLAMDRGNRSLHHRLQDLAVKFRVSQGSYDEPEPDGRGVGNTLLEWAQRRLPAPNLKSPRLKSWYRRSSTPVSIAKPRRNCFRWCDCSPPFSQLWPVT